MIFEAWGGISSVGFGLPILYTEGLKLQPPISLAEINKWCSLNTAKQVGLSHCKGQIKVDSMLICWSLIPNRGTLLKIKRPILKINSLHMMGWNSKVES